MIYKSKFLKNDTYDWFCGPGSQLCNYRDFVLLVLCTNQDKGNNIMLWSENI